MPVSSWSGGRTTEIFIFPVGERYSDRNFLFRISTAEVELDSSDFNYFIEKSFHGFIIRIVPL